VELGAEGLDIRWERLRRTKNGAAADLIISAGGDAVKYNVYLYKIVELQFQSTDRSRVELAARLLRLAGVGAEVKKEGNRDVWYVEATPTSLRLGPRSSEKPSPRSSRRRREALDRRRQGRALAREAGEGTYVDRGLAEVLRGAGGWRAGG
jgi:hypothetical protein